MLNNAALSQSLLSIRSSLAAADAKTSPQLADAAAQFVRKAIGSVGSNPELDERSRNLLDAIASLSRGLKPQLDPGSVEAQRQLARQHLNAFERTLARHGA